MAGWRKLHLPGTFVAKVPSCEIPPGVQPKNLLERLPCKLIFVKSCGLNRRKNPIEIPPGFPPRKRSGACARTAPLALEPNSLALSTVPELVSGDCAAQSPR